MRFHPRRSLVVAIRSLGFSIVLVGIAFASGACSGSKVAGGGGPGPQVVASEPGTLTGGQQLILENGSRLTVPAGWNVWLLTRGALVTAPPEATGNPGAFFDGTGTAQWCSGYVTVYGPRAGYRDQFSRAENAYQSSRVGQAPRGATLSRVDLPMGRDTSAAAYVTTWDGRADREVAMFIERRDANPACIIFAVFAPPPGSDLPSDAALPRFLLDFVDFKNR